MEKHSDCICCEQRAKFSSRSDIQDEKGDGCTTKINVICSKHNGHLKMQLLATPGSPKDPKDMEKGSFCTLCGKPAHVECLECKDCRKIYHFSCLNTKNAEYAEMTEEKKKNWRCKSCCTEASTTRGERIECLPFNSTVEKCDAGNPMKEDGRGERIECLPFNGTVVKCGAGNPMKEDRTPKSYGKQIAKHVAICAGLSGACIVGVPLVLGAAGFGASGVAAGSVAALWQSTIGNVAAGSLFATCQSVGAAGLATSTQVGIAAGVSTGTTVVSSVRHFFGKEKEK